jgi:hypothetical protein
LITEPAQVAGGTEDGGGDDGADTEELRERGTGLADRGGELVASVAPLSVQAA